MKWRLGISLGTSSLGWSAVTLHDEGVPVGITASGVRIFGDGRDARSGASLAVGRRDARAMRRRRDRFKQRQAALLKHLTLDGLFPADPSERKALSSLDPFLLRAHALDGRLPLSHLGRALLHLNQRRGFKSNRKADVGKDEDVGKVAVGIQRLRNKMMETGARTIGEFLHSRRASAADQNNIPSVRMRLRPEIGTNTNGEGYDFYPGRDLISEEFEAIWDVQAPHYPDVLTQEVYSRLYEIIFHQRPLKAPAIGVCTLVPEEHRLPKAHPLFQRRRLLEEVNALMIVRPGEVARRLSLQQRDILLAKLGNSRRVTFESLRKALKLEPDTRFNRESENRSALQGDEVAAELGSRTRFGTRWRQIAPDSQWKIVARLREEEDEATLKAWLASNHDLSPEQADAVAAARLPQGFGRFGATATEKLIAALQAGVISHGEAIEQAGLGRHGDFRTGEVHDRLPYYGVSLERHIMPGTAELTDPEETRVGRLTNPTAHIGFNQLRRMVNALIRTYGRPEQIAVELSRELKLTESDKKRLNRQNDDNKLAAERRSQKLLEIGQTDSGSNRARLKLWEELNPHNVLDRRCIYKGTMISIDMLFDGSAEIDHILPFQSTLDDSDGNKILCSREARHEKRKRSPYETWGHTSEWERIAIRAEQLPIKKRWRFQPDAMASFNKKGGFVARHLFDTQYLSRLMREYLGSLYAETEDGSSHVWVSPGSLTEIVRRKLGLNDLFQDHDFAGDANQPGNRLDHRHHAIDAAVIAIVDPAMLQKISHASGQAGTDAREQILIPEPWSGFRSELRDRVNDITVKHRAEHGTVAKAGLPKGQDQTAGRLHNDTAYGFTGDTDARGNPIVVRRVPLTTLRADDLTGDGKRWVVDDTLRRALAEFAREEGLETALSDFAQAGPEDFRNVRRVRLAQPLNVIPIHDEQGRAYKGYKGDSNYRFDVWELRDGDWKSEVVSMFEAHHPGWTSRVRAGAPTARKVLSLRRNDLIAVEQEEGERRLLRVVKFGQAGTVVLAEPHEAGLLKTRDAASIDIDPFKYVSKGARGLRKSRARQVRIDDLGRIFDPGFPARTATRRKKGSTATNQ